MNDRSQEELKLLQACFGDLEFVESGQWVRIPEYSIPFAGWSQEIIEICFQIPEQLPGQAPYGFYVRPDLRLADGSMPDNYTFPASTPFGTEWGQFSWSLNPWVPARWPAQGSNMLNFVRSFSERFRQGK